MSSVTSILLHNNKILLILRDDKPEIPDPNTWQLPGGGVEEGESHEEAIKRELLEEISVAPQNLRYIGSAPGDVKAYIAVFSESEVSNIRLGDEGQKLEFFSLEEMNTITLTKRLKSYIEKFHSGFTELVETHNIVDPAKLGLLP